MTKPILNKEYMMELLRDFKNTQPKKKRNNIDQLFHKMITGKELNRRNKETYKEWQNFFASAVLKGVVIKGVSKN
ncbi:hypothetical protein PQ478_09095 [Alkalihalophilus pseudofirmus]|uniref:hypothetical protein n=1 Tax=Alkalihalophilus pseudofirmus TaxID=79885 RepID=UPI00259BE675|nr:hypothetical protein [Alkalihalophilus pseudofirmus]WEG18627.1 hypothetical protein PQ478_09095 [Alkalihalophilus pseudofirmus]